MEKLKTKAGKRRHNKEGQWKDKLLFIDEYGRNPTKNERRDDQRRRTGGHEHSIDRHFDEYLARKPIIPPTPFPRVRYMGVPIIQHGRVLSWIETEEVVRDCGYKFERNYRIYCETNN